VGRRIALIPAHDEAATVARVVAGALPHVDAVRVVDDGSSDDTAAEARSAGAQVVAHAENRGKGRRLAEGLDAAFAAGAEAVVTLDADGQHDPGAIPAFLAAAEAHPGALVIGNRFHDPAAIPRGRARSIRFGNFFVGWACGQAVPDAQCGMRLYPRSAWRAAAVPEPLRERFVFETAVLLPAAEAGVPFVFEPVAARYAGFQQRPSHFRPAADFAEITVAVTRFLVTRGLRPRGLLRALRALR